MKAIHKKVEEISGNVEKLEREFTNHDGNNNIKKVENKEKINESSSELILDRSSTIQKLRVSWEGDDDIETFMGKIKEEPKRINQREVVKLRRESLAIKEEPKRINQREVVKLRR